MGKIKSILKKQSSVRVVLNGGKFELNDATIPFQIGFDESIANLKPTHILVVDVTENYFYQSGERKNYNSQAERSLFKLEPIQYLQLKRPGIHHLVFILFSGVDSDYYEYLMMKNHSSYENDLWFESIENNDLKHQVGYAEVIITVPEIFFAKEPETKFERAIYAWTNSWHNLKPVDECEYRKRRIFAFTVKPILWFLGFIPRFVLSIVWATLMFLMRIGSFIVGVQPVSFFANKRMLFVDFLLMYPKEGYEDVLKGNNWFGNRDGDGDIDFYPYKTLAIGKNRIYTPVTLFGLIFYSLFFLLYFLKIYLLFNKQLGIGENILNLIALAFIVPSIALLIVSTTLPTFKSNEEWGKKWNCKTTNGKKRSIIVGKWIFIIFISIAVFLTLITQVEWTNLWKVLVSISFLFLITSAVLIAGYFLTKLLSKFYKKIYFSIKERARILAEKSNILTKEELHQQWLYKSFDIKNLPQKVDIKTAPEPSTYVHHFTVSFWQLKAKVCKPYAKK